jgi:molybdenum cofactor cytidylyltransferase
MEIVTRPHLRENPPEPSHSLQYAAVMLAAGRGTRMAQENKLLAEVRGKPILRLAVEAVLSSKARPVIVVTGHESERIVGALKGLDVKVVYNPYYHDGLSSSLKAGLAALPPGTDAVAVALGDMPEISGGLIDRLAAAIHPERGTLIAVPVRHGKRGNPVMWSRRLFEELAKLEGDVGARHLIGIHSEAIAEVSVDDDGVLLDVDTQEALAAIRVRQ